MFPNPTTPTIHTAHSEASSAVGRHVLVHYADDDCVGSDHMARSSGRGGFAVIVERLP